MNHAVHDAGQPDIEVRVASLLRELLAEARRSGDTPLQFGIDAPEIAHNALANLQTNDPTVASTADWPLLRAGLETLVNRYLQEELPRPGDEGPCPPPGREWPTAMAEASSPVNGFHPLTQWLEHLYRTLRGVHPRAIDILALRAEGYTDRDIAERLGMGLRLVKRILQDLRASRATTRGEA
ncbi:MAG: hypothetical protein AB1705_15045 [Verrucomicrobiota bacterium]